MTEHVLTALAKRRAELAGEADTLRTRLAAIATDMGHLDAVIRQFDPDYSIASIRPKRPRGPDVAGRGERSRRCSRCCARRTSRWRWRRSHAG